MDPTFVIVFLALLAGLLLGLLAGWFWFSKGKQISVALESQIREQQLELERAKVKVAEARNEVKIAENEARTTAKDIISEAKIQASSLEAKLEAELEKAAEKDKALDKKVQEVERQRGTLQKKEEEIEGMKKELGEAAQSHRTALEQVSKLSEEEAKKQLSAELKDQFSGYFAQQIQLEKDRLKDEYEEHAKQLMVEAMHRYASEVATESTATIVQLPSDDIKGKIIGKEGRNISTFEQLTGVDIIIDDTPGAIIITGYDLARRYVAKLAMETLIKDGRIQPARIEEVVEKMKVEVHKMMLEFGKRAATDLGIAGYPQELLRIIGRLRFRTSYGQNILKHSVEMAHIGRMIAEELGADSKIVVEGCLLHDIGKALDHEVAGTHVEIGVEICKKFNVRPEVIHCVAAHHEDIPIASPEAFIVAAVDAISGARPGSRKESVEAYVKRLKELEEVARSFPGVQKAYAISAGREIRVFVDAAKVDDLRQEELARDITKKIEQQLTYPGVIKVNVIRDRRIVESAT